MSVFVRELPASLAYLVIIAGVVLMAGANPPRWQGVAVFALGLGALTTITIVTGRLRIKGPQELSREETPFLFWLAVCFMLFLTGSAIVYTVTAPLRLVGLLDRRYQKVQLGMHSNEVQMLMNFQAQWTTQYLAAYWDDTRLNPAQTQRIRCALRYSVTTSFLPVTFEFTFDDRGKVVGRHRYD